MAKSRFYGDDAASTFFYWATTTTDDFLRQVTRRTVVVGGIFLYAFWSAQMARPRIAADVEGICLLYGRLQVVPWFVDVRFACVLVLKWF